MIKKLHESEGGSLVRRQIFEAPPSLSARARRFVRVHGVRLDVPSVSDWRQQWEANRIPSAVVDRADSYQVRWGGLALPPSPSYDGGPRMLCADTPEWEDAFPEPGWWFEAGPQRTAVPYSFVIGPDESFGIAMDSWVPLHASIEGWIESLALAYAAEAIADTVTNVSGVTVADLDLSRMQPVPETAGIADQWWHGAGSLIAIYNGEAVLFGRPGYQVARVYSGNIDMEWL
ncbi:hypothetical protein ABT346_30780 [Micromonospora peucetia]|uniref:hypothetical protein n=1 Tax=Micromonospora peucetia TaxID=47871 RepID=UPI00332D6A0C